MDSVRPVSWTFMNLPILLTAFGVRGRQSSSTALKNRMEPGDVEAQEALRVLTKPAGRRRPKIRKD